MSAREQKQEIADLKELLVEVQWSAERRIDYDDGVPCCPVCGGVQPIAYARREGRVDGGFEGHAEDCRLALAAGCPTGDYG